MPTRKRKQRKAHAPNCRCPNCRARRSANKFRTSDPLQDMMQVPRGGRRS